MFQKSIQSEALSLAKAQKTLANSPGEWGADGKNVLCAASCIAYTALKEKYGVSYADAYFNKAILNSDKTMVQRVFEQFGRPKAECSRIMVQNDSIDRRERLGWFEEYLD